MRISTAQELSPLKGQLIFVGFGLDGASGLSLEAIDVLKAADRIFIENYTNFIDSNILNELVSLLERSIEPLSRADLEQGESKFLELCETKRIALLVSGDPFIATTHISLRLGAVRKGIPVRIINAPSVLSVASSYTGLSAYRFGRSATVGFQRSRYCYDILSANLQIDAHTVLLLDINVDSRRFLDVNTAISQLRDLEEEYREGAFTERNLLFGLARVGRMNAVIKVGNPTEIDEVDWKAIDPPQSIIVCGKLQAYEEEAIQVLWERKVPGG